MAPLPTSSGFPASLAISSWGERVEITPMKKYIILTYFIVLLLYGAEVSAAPTVHRDEELGFEVSYLNNWEIDHTPNRAFIFSIKNTSTTEPATIGIGARRLAGDKDGILSEIKNTPEIYVERLKRRFPDAALLEHGESYLGGFPCSFVTVTYTIRNLNSSLDVIATQIFCIKGANVYLVSFESPSESYDKNLSEFNAIMTTFVFL